MSVSPTSTCDSDDLLEQYNASQAASREEREHHATNERHARQIAAVRVKSNAQLAEFGLMSVPLTTKESVPAVLRSIQQENETMDKIANAQVAISAKFLQSMRRSFMLREQLLKAGVPEQNYKLLIANNDSYLTECGRLGCNRALRIFRRQSVEKAKRAPLLIRHAPAAAAPTKEVPAPKPKRARKPRAPKGKENKEPEAKMPEVKKEYMPNITSSQYNPDIDYEAFSF